MNDLLRSTSHLSKLEILHLPRSSTQESKRNGNLDCGWPVNLNRLHVSSVVRFNSLPFLERLPPSLSHLILQNLPNMHEVGIFTILDEIGPRLRSLQLLAPIPALPNLFPDFANHFLTLTPNLKYLKISADFLDEGFFECNLSDRATITRLDLHCLDPTACTRLTPSSVYNAVGVALFARVRTIGVHHLLGWHTSDHREILSDTDQLLKTLAKGDRSEGNISEAEAGVIILKGP